MRKMVLVALASGSFGGMGGAFATVATPSSASPAAIAAALKVQDSKAEAYLHVIAENSFTVCGYTITTTPSKFTQYCKPSP
jgi:hypothetical protein